MFSGGSRISGKGAGWRVAEGHEVWCEDHDGAGHWEGVSPPHWGGVWVGAALLRKKIEI